MINNNHLPGPNYWLKQSKDKPLYPEIEWNKPERLDQAGKLGIVGGSKLGFVAAAESYQTAKKVGAGEVRVLLPDALRKNVPSSMTDVLFAPTNNSGGLANEAEQDLKSLISWSDVTLFIGDAGKNSQTAIIYETLVAKADKPVILTRDAMDLVQNSFATILDNPNVLFVASFAQLQRLFRAVYYPKMLTFSMQLSILVETLHKFTLTYPVTIMTLHANQLLIAKDGDVVTQPWDEPMRIWRGDTATKAACYLLWNTNVPLKALSYSII